MQAAGAGGGSGDASQVRDNSALHPQSRQSRSLYCCATTEGKRSEALLFAEPGTGCQTFDLHSGGKGRLFVHPLWRNSWKYGSGNNDGCGNCYRRDDSCCVSKVDSLSGYFSPSSLINPELLRLQACLSVRDKFGVLPVFCTGDGFHSD